MEGWVGLVRWPIADALPTKWSHVNHGSGVDQWKSASYRPTFLPLSHAAKQQFRWSSDCGQGPGDCSRRTDQQWQKPGGRTCWVGYVVRAVDLSGNEISVDGHWDAVNGEVLNQHTVLLLIISGICKGWGLGDDPFGVMRFLAITG